MTAGRWAAAALAGASALAGALLVIGPLQGLPFGSSPLDSPWAVAAGAALLLLAAATLAVLVSRARRARAAGPTLQGHAGAPGDDPGTELRAARRASTALPRARPPADTVHGDSVVLRSRRGALVAALMGAAAFAAAGLWIVIASLTGALDVDGPIRTAIGVVIGALAVGFFGVLGIPVLARRIRHASRAVVLAPLGLTIEGRGAVAWRDVLAVRAGAGELLVVVAPTAYAADLASRWVLDRWMQRANRAFRGSALALPRLEGVSSRELALWIEHARAAHLLGQPLADRGGVARGVGG